MKTLDVMRGVLSNPEQMIADWKAQGKKIVGYQCSYVPEEIIYAADMWPYPLFGTPEAIGMANSYFGPFLCEFVRNIFDRRLKGELSHLDGLALCNTCEAVCFLYDYWDTYIQTPFCYLINGPRLVSNSLSLEYCRHEQKEFVKAIENFSGKTISKESLHEAIKLHNETRALLRELYSLRKKDSPPLSGAEALDIVMASMLMPKQQANELLNQLLEELKTRQDIPKNSGPRILISGSIIDNPTLIQMVEEVGGLVVAEDLCTAIKYFWYDVKEDGDPFEALCRHNTERCLCPVVNPAEARFDYLRQLIEEFRIEAVIYVILKFCDAYFSEGVLFRQKLQELGIPSIALEVGHDLSGLGQLRTRVQAFTEMIG